MDSSEYLTIDTLLFSFLFSLYPTGIMMTLAWILFAFVGLFTARYMRQVWEPTELLGKKAWFTVSISCT